MRFIQPKTLHEVLKAKSETGYPIIAGGTDLVAQWKAGAERPAGVISVCGISELQKIAEALSVSERGSGFASPSERGMGGRSAPAEGGSASGGSESFPPSKIEIGALATHTDIIESEIIQKYLPALVVACKTIGSVQIQNRGTIGGNVMNASPAGDTLPVLLAYEAEVELASVKGKRRAPFDKFYTGYRKTAAGDDEIVTRFIVNNVAAGFLLSPPRSIGGSPPERAVFMKIGTRKAQAISKICACFRYKDGGFIIAYGSVAPTPIRCYKTEAFLNNQNSQLVKPDPKVIEFAANLVQEEITPIDDIRSDASYRKHICAVLFRRFLQEPK